MGEKLREIPEEYVGDILTVIKDYLPLLEEGIDQIEDDIQFKQNPNVNEEVKALMKTIGAPNTARLTELKDRRERLETIQKMLSK